MICLAWNYTRTTTSFASELFLIYTSTSEIKIRLLITFKIRDHTFQEPTFLTKTSALPS